MKKILVGALAAWLLLLTIAYSQSGVGSLPQTTDITGVTVAAVTQSGTWTMQPGNTANTTAWKVDGSAVTQPVSGTFWQATQPISVASIPSHAVTNAGTFAVQSAVADGANVTLGAKADAKSTATDTTAITIMQVLKQISASAQAPPSQAVTNAGTFLVQDNSGALAAKGQGATGAAVPSGATYLGGNSSGNLTGLVICDNFAILDMSTATTTQIVALSSSKIIYICHETVMANGTTVVTRKYGTGSNCGTGTTSSGAAWDLTAQSGFSRGGGLGMIAKNIASNAFCYTSSAAVNVHIEIAYTQF